MKVKQLCTIVQSYKVTSLVVVSLVRQCQLILPQF